MLPVLTTCSALWALYQGCQPFNLGGGFFVLVLCLLLTLRKIARRSTASLMVFGFGAVTVAMLLLDVPTRIAFFTHRPLLEGLPEKQCFMNDCAQRVGLFQVEEVWRDEEDGSRFLRTHSEGEGLGPDILSSGFAFRPRPRQTPFGSAHLRWLHLGGNWYAFQVSDDF